MMILKIFLVCSLISGSCLADVFESLYEAQDKEGKAMACVSDVSHDRSLRSCQGILWRRSWLLVRASCFRYARDPYVQKGISNCTRSNSTTALAMTQCDEKMCIRYVVAMYMHPRFPETDLAMLRFDAPFSAETRASNYNLEQKLDEWEKFIGDYYSSTTAGKIQIRHYQMYSTPAKMFIITVVLPTVSFILFFLYIIFYTGSDKTFGKDIRVPYINLSNKEENQKIN